MWCREVGVNLLQPGGSGGYRGGGGRGDHPPPLVAENFVCSSSNFSPTGAITPDHPPPPPLWPSPPPPSENPVSAPEEGYLEWRIVDSTLDCGIEILIRYRAIRESVSKFTVWGKTRAG